MASIFSPSAAVAKATARVPQTAVVAGKSIGSVQIQTPGSKQAAINRLVGGAAAVAVIVSGGGAAVAEGYEVYYGTAASAANYGGYGGNSSNKASAEYVYDVPPGWKERLVSKVEKGTNGTDSEFFNPKKKKEKEYLTFLAGYRQLAPREVILNNLALSDVVLQDLIAGADSVASSEEERGGGQPYYIYEITAPGAHSLISVTCANNKLYAHFVNAPSPDWTRDKDMLLRLHHSFHTVSSAPPLS